MNIPVSLTFTESQYKHLKNHLYPGDNKEAVAIAVCGYRAGSRRHRLTVQRIYEIPYAMCSIREENIITWPTDSISDLLDEAEEKSLSLVKIHSHPSGYADFSDTDIASDDELFPVRRQMKLDIQLQI